MRKNLLFIGIDVDDKSFNVAIISKTTGELKHFKCKPTFGALCKKLDKIKEAGDVLKICYESTYLGFSLCRNIRKHGYDCQVIAASLIPDRPGKKVKTDKIDSKKLAIYYMQGLLTIVNLPDENDEANRDLIRSRAFIVQQAKALKTHITSTCKRMNIDYKNETGLLHYWTNKHRIWIDKRVKELPENNYLKINLASLIATLNQLENTIKFYEDKITEMAKEKKYENKTKSLIAYRGIKTLTAMTIITELGDINRFSHPRKLVSYLGLDIIEYSSGGKQRKYGITKMGNGIVRKALVESSQYASRPPAMSRALLKRREGLDTKYLEIADKCMQRLNKKSYRMLKQNKNGNLVKVACAREMVGFIWETLKLAS